MDFLSIYQLHLDHEEICPIYRSFTGELYSKFSWESARKWPEVDRLRMC